MPSSLYNVNYILLKRLDHSDTRKCRRGGLFWSALLQECTRGYHANMLRKLFPVFKKEKPRKEDTMSKKPKEQVEKGRKVRMKASPPPTLDQEVASQQNENEKMRKELVIEQLPPTYKEVTARQWLPTMHATEQEEEKGQSVLSPSSATCNTFQPIIFLLNFSALIHIVF